MNLLLCGSPPEKKLSSQSEDYVRDLAKKLKVIYCGVRERMEEKTFENESLV